MACKWWSGTNRERFASPISAIVGDYSSAVILYCRGFRWWPFLLVSILQLVGYPSLWQVLESRTIGKRGNSANPCSSGIFPTLENQEEVDPIVSVWLHWLATWLSMVTLLNLTSFSRVVLAKLKRKRTNIFSSSFIHFKPPERPQSTEVKARFLADVSALRFGEEARISRSAWHPSGWINNSMHAQYWSMKSWLRCRSFPQLVYLFHFASTVARNLRIKFYFR